MLIHLDDYRKPKRAVQPESGHREEALLCVNWNTAIIRVAHSWYQTPQELSPDLPHDGAAIEPAFMNRVYALASQI